MSARWPRCIALAFVIAPLLLSQTLRAATQTFQALGYEGGDLAIITPTRLLTAATFIRPDAGFHPVGFVTALARDPTSGKIFVVAANFESDSHLGQVDFQTGAETTIGLIPGQFVVGLAFDGTGHLYGLTDSQTLIAIDKRTAASSVVKVLDSHGSTHSIDGAIAWNPADGFLYYGNLGSDEHLFIDKLAPGIFTQTSVLASHFQAVVPPTSMVFVAGRLWFTTGIWLYSADANAIAKDFTSEGHPTYLTADGPLLFYSRSIIPIALSCVPSATVACLHNRFRVEVTYDARPENGSGPANVVLESPESVKFSFSSAGSIELVVKILNSCASGPKKWRIFVGGLTDAGTSIRITDTVNGAVKIYSSQKGKLLQSRYDTLVCP